jgi:hypothetical protein
MPKEKNQDQKKEKKEVKELGAVPTPGLGNNDLLDSKKLKENADKAISEDNAKPIVFSGEKMDPKELEIITSSLEEGLKKQKDYIIPETGTDNAPPLELDKEALGEILEKQSLEDEKRDEVRNSTESFGNGENEWKLIQKTYNNFLDWEHVTTAMKVGTRGVIVHVKEAVGQKVNSTSIYIDNGKLVEKKGKWFIN